MIRQRVGQWSARAYFATSFSLISRSAIGNIITWGYNIVNLD